MTEPQHPTHHDIKINGELVSSGFLSQIPGNAFKIFLVLTSRATVLGDRSDDDRFFDELKAKNIVTENDRGRLFCYLTHTDICELTGLTKNTVTSQTDILANLELVEKRSIPTGRGRGTFNIYFILPTALVDKNDGAKNGTGNPKHSVNNRDGNNNNRSKIGTNLILIDSDSDNDFDSDSIFDYFAHRKNDAAYRPTAHDRQHLADLRAAGCTTRLMQRAIDVAFETRPAAAPPIRQLSYCAPIARKLMTETATAAVAVQNSSPDAPAPLTGDTDSLLGYAAALYGETFGAPPAEKMLNALIDLVREYPDADLLAEAFRRGKKYGARSLAYIRKILENETNSDTATAAATSATEAEQPENPGTSSVPPTPPTPSAPPAPLQLFWENLLKHIRGQMTRAAFNQWVAPARPLEKSEETLIIGVRNKYAREWLEHRLRKIVERAVSVVNGAPLAVEFTVV